MYGMYRGNIGVLGLDKSGWQFALAAEGGVAFFRKEGPGGLKLAARYVGGFGNDAISSISFLSFSIGLMNAF